MADFPVPPPQTAKAKPKRVRESTIEKTLADGVEAEGGLCWKFTSPGRRGVPDRLPLRPIPPRHRAIVAKYVRFAELKTKRGKLSEHQKARRAELEALGFQVEVLASREAVAAFLKGWK